MKNEQLKQRLTTIIEEEPNSIRAEVAREALGYGSEDIVNFFSDLLQYGCQSGMVSGLIYYCDTHAFFDRYYDEIEDIRYELEESLGEPLKPNGDLKNGYAWLGFEETARLLTDELEIEW